MTEQSGPLDADVFRHPAAQWQPDRPRMRRLLAQTEPVSHFPDGEPIPIPPEDAWDAWSPVDVAARMDGLDVFWCVVAGWAIDLFLGGQKRAHEDLEMEVLRDDFPAVRRQFDDLQFCDAYPGQLRALAAEEVPVGDHHQCWGLDVAAQQWRVDVMLQPGDADTWVFRRDESITAPRSSMVGRTSEGIPFLLPHGVLLYKAKAARPKDEADFAAAVPLMDDGQRRWLSDALTHAHPGHAWIERLA